MSYLLTPHQPLTFSFLPAASCTRPHPFSPPTVLILLSAACPLPAPSPWPAYPGVAGTRDEDGRSGPNQLRPAPWAAGTKGRIQDRAASSCAVVAAQTVISCCLGAVCWSQACACGDVSARPVDQTQPPVRDSRPCISPFFLSSASGAQAVKSNTAAS